LIIPNPESQVENQDRLVVKDLVKAFLTPAGNHLEVLRGVSFSADAGEMLAIMGASGAGKSTLLHVLGGLEVADGGSVQLSEFDVGRARGPGLARYRNEAVGFVFQFHHLLPDLTAAENVVLPLRISRLVERESRERAFAALKSMGLGERTAHLVSHLSGGEQQRVALARALVKRPRLVLADEPTGNLDADAGDMIATMLNSYCRRERAIVIIATHNPLMAQACDRRLILEGGRISES
jgi:lipoprotein-releasing system ATP-binding protein